MRQIEILCSVGVGCNIVVAGLSGHDGWEMGEGEKVEVRRERGRKKREDSFAVLI